MEDKLNAFIIATNAQVEAIKENTKVLQEIKSEMRKQSALSERQEERLTEMNRHFTNGFKSDIIDKVLDASKKTSEAEEKIVDKISSIATAIKVQWVMISTGLVPLLYYILSAPKP